MNGSYFSKAFKGYMRPECITILRKYIVEALIKQAGNSTYNIFDGLVSLMQTNWDSSPTTMAEIRKYKKTKDKGDLFEHFALLYFTHVYKLNKKEAVEVYLLSDAPEHILLELNLKRHDMGIDLLIRFENDGWCAVQVKYRKPNAYKQMFGVSWADLSTFYALVNRSGPYAKHIIITNSHYVRHIGKKDAKDQSICIGTLRNITKEQWILMANIQGNTLGSSLNNTLSQTPPLGDVPSLKTNNDNNDNNKSESSSNVSSNLITNSNLNGNITTNSSSNSDISVSFVARTNSGIVESNSNSSEISSDISANNSNINTNSDLSSDNPNKTRIKLPIIRLKVKNLETDKKEIDKKSVVEKLSIEELRKKRLAFFANK